MRERVLVLETRDGAIVGVRAARAARAIAASGRDDRRVFNPNLLDDRSAPARALLEREGVEVGHHLRPQLRVALLRLLA